MSLCVAEHHVLTRLIWAGLKCEPNIHKASFIERRLFYLNRLHVVARRALFPTKQSSLFQAASVLATLAPHTHMLSRKSIGTMWRAVLGSAGMTIYKGMQ